MNAHVEKPTRGPQVAAWELLPVKPPTLDGLLKALSRSCSALCSITQHRIRLQKAVHDSNQALMSLEAIQDSQAISANAASGHLACHNVHNMQNAKCREGSLDTRSKESKAQAGRITIRQEGRVDRLEWLVRLFQSSKRARAPLPLCYGGSQTESFQYRILQHMQLRLICCLAQHNDLCTSKQGDRSQRSNPMKSRVVDPGRLATGRIIVLVKSCLEGADHRGGVGALQGASENTKASVYPSRPLTPARHPVPFWDHESNSGQSACQRDCCLRAWPSDLQLADSSSSRQSVGTQGEKLHEVLLSEC